LQLISLAFANFEFVGGNIFRGVTGLYGVLLAARIIGWGSPGSLPLPARTSPALGGDLVPRVQVLRTTMTIEVDSRRCRPSYDMETGSEDSLECEV